MSQICAVCKEGKSPTKCEICGFSDNSVISREFVNVEDANYWLETVVRPYRIQWEASKRETELLAQIEAFKQNEMRLLSELEQEEEQRKRREDQQRLAEEKRKREEELERQKLEKQRKTKEARWKKGRAIGNISLVLYAIIFVIGYFACPAVHRFSFKSHLAGLFGLAVMIIIFLIPHGVIIATKSTEIRIAFTVVAVGVCLYFLSNLPFTCHSAEVPFAIAAIICNGVACIMAAIFPSKP